MNRFVLSLLSLFLYCEGSAIAQTQTIYLGAEENSFYQLVNQFRKKLNLPTFEIHVYLQNAAKAHSSWMSQQDFLSHYGPTNEVTPFMRMEQAGYVNYTYAGENIACGHGNAVETFRQWAASPSHLENMLNPNFRQMGVSRAGSGKERCPYYWTTDYGSFTRPGKDPTPMTDLQLITQAITEVTGSPPAKPVALPNTPTNTPAPMDDEDEAEAESPAPSVPSPLASNVGMISTLQCMIPYKLSKGTVTFVPNTDTLVEATRSSRGAVTLKLSYFQDTQSANLSPVSLTGVSLVTSSEFPIVSLFSAPARGMGGFTIQMNTKTNQAQYNSYNLAPALSGPILCTVKYF